MTLEEKAGQLIQAERASITPEEVRRYYVGSVLSGGGSFPNSVEADSTADKWRKLVDQYHSGALSTRLGIPILYGVDGIHGHNNVIGATLFPHNIGLGAGNNPDLVHKIGAATAKEIQATGVNWNFAPTIAAPENIRWGRTYEGYSDKPEISAVLGSAYILGLQDGEGPSFGRKDRVVGTAKHFIGEGYTDNGTNQGNTTHYTEEEILKKDLDMYKQAVDAGVQTVMASYHSIQGLKMHANKKLLTDVLKGELGFQGFVISDYNAIQQITRDQDGNAVSGLKNQVRASINAGVDMLMLTGDWKNALAHIISLVKEKAITEERLDDAVTRILRVKFDSGVFEYPKSDGDLAPFFGAENHRKLASQAVSESLVLLKNDEVNGSPILSQLGDAKRIFVAGKNADNIGNQSGGWSITWQGKSGNITTGGTTILQGIKDKVGANNVTFNLHGRGAAGHDVAIAVLGETPYAESAGDRSELGLDMADLATLQNVRASGVPTIVILVSGRPLLIADQLKDMDALIAAWLPGTEGQGVADVLFGNHDFTGKNPIRWPFSITHDYPIKNSSSSNLLFDTGYGLTKSQPTPVLPVKPAEPEAKSYPIPGKIEAEDFAAKSSGLNTETTSDEGGGLNVGWSAAGAWLEYNADVKEAGTYRVDFRVAVNAANASLRVKLADGTTAGTFQTTTSGGWQSWKTASLENVVIPKAGKQKLRIEYVTGGLNFNWMQFTRTGDVPDGGVGNPESPNNGEQGETIAADAVEAWVTRERDPSDRRWYYADRSHQGDPRLTKQENLDLQKPGSGTMTTITLDPDKKYQSMLGIGTSMEESTVYNLVKMSEEKQQEVLHKLFDPVDGAGMSLVRLTIGTSDFTAQKFYSYNDLPPGETDVELKKFSIQKDIDFGIIPTVKKMQAINPDLKFFASPWSPPGWTKTTGSMVRGQIIEEYLPVVAKYYVKFLEAYAEHGIYFEAMTLQNEPLLEIDYPSTRMSWQQTARLAKLMRAELDKHSNEKIKQVKLWMFDHNPGDTMAFPALILRDNVEGAYDAVDGTAFHDYGGELSMMSQLHDMFPEKNAYLTERAVWGTTGADRIVQYFRNWARSYNTWVTMLDSDINKHQWVGIPDPTPIVQDSSDRDNYWLLPEYYLFGQFSKFVKPGYVRIDSNYGSANTVTNVAFESPDGTEIVVVAVNRTDEAQPFRILADGQQITAKLPAKSAGTYRWKRSVSLPGEVTATAFTKAEGDYNVHAEGYVEIGHEGTGASLNYTVNVQEAGSYEAKIRLAAEGASGEVQLYLDNSSEPIASVPVIATDGGRFAETRVLANLPAGNHKLTVRANGAAYKLKSIAFAKPSEEATPLPGLLQADSFKTADGVLADEDGAYYGTGGSTATYKVDVPVTGDYALTYRYAASGDAAVVLSADGEQLDPTELPSTGGLDSWGSAETTVRLNAGEQVLRISAQETGSKLRLKWLAIGPVLQIDNPVIYEGEEDNHSFEVSLLGGTFQETLDHSKWELTGYDEGTSIRSVDRLNDTTARVTLQGTRTKAFDKDRTITLSVDQSELTEPHYGGNVRIYGVLKAVVVNRPAYLEVLEGQVPYGQDAFNLTLKLDGSVFAADKLDQITLSGPGVTNGYIGSKHPQLIDPNTVRLTIFRNPSVFYETLDLNIEVPADVFTGRTALHASVKLEGTEKNATPVPLLQLNAVDQFNRIQGIVVTGTGNQSRLTEIDTGDWIDYYVNVPEAGQYTVTFTAASRVLANNGLQIKTDSGSGWKVQDQITVPNLYEQVAEIRSTLDLPTGAVKIRLEAAAGGYEIRGIRFEKHVPFNLEKGREHTIQAESYFKANTNAIQTQTAGFKNVGFTIAGSTFYYDLQVEEAGYYKVTYRYATQQNGVRFALSAGDSEPYIVAAPNTGNWATYNELVSGIKLNAGRQTLKLTMLGEGANIDWFKLIPAEEEPQQEIGGEAEIPKSSLKPGIYSETKRIELSSATPGAKIYYTLDGSLPTAEHGQLYKEPLTLSETIVLRTIAIKPGAANSFVSAFTYIVKEAEPGRAAAPTASPVPGTYSSAQKVTLTSATEEAQIYYTLDGSQPTESSTEYTGSLDVKKSVVIKAIAVKEGLEASETAVLSYTINSAPYYPSQPVTQPETDKPDEETPETGTKDGQISLSDPKLDTATGVAKASVSEKELNEAVQSAKPDNKGIKRIAIQIPAVSEANGYELELPSAALTAGKSAIRLQIDTATGQLLIPDTVLAGLNLSETDQVSVIIAKASANDLPDSIQAAVGERPVIKLSFAVNGKIIEWSNPQAPVQVKVPYKSGAADQAVSELLSIRHVAGKGAVTSVYDGKYSAASGAVQFTAVQDGWYAVVYEHKTFNDLGNHSWAQQAIEVLAAKGIINGVSDNSYAPRQDVKRADFALLLVKALGLTGTASASFTDVQEGSYYYEAVGIAHSLGIVNGKANGGFDPNAPVTRQEMFAMVARALKLTDKELVPADSNSLASFQDLSSLASYAKEGAALLAANGIVKGSGSKLNPLGLTTRAEAAQLIYEIYKR
ncbi:carbohydrate-binding protein [Paenibacillus sp. MAHUQ-46]|uniref:beta-glucosidase n=2 Tax=Paenibacillus TaxID=44249 RepID=A0A934J915_9BACL|nr:carbohydrate-binding protein [Paenibacillus roseus]